MPSRRQDEVYLPGWLWFFLILPIGLVVALIYRNKRLPQFLDQMRPFPRPFTPANRQRYVEPDSIPLEIRPEEVRVEEVEIGTDEEDVAISRMMAEGSPAETGAPQGQQAAADDLQIIEGIGPSIAGLLRDEGIVTFRQLAETPVERLDEILTKARLRRLADPGTWAEQANLAAEGNWEALKQLQDTLKGGRRTKPA